MKMIGVIVLVVLCISSSTQGTEKKAFMMREDFGTEALLDSTCYLQYYYFVPCPTYSWFWGFYGWSCGDVIGTLFTVGDQPTGAFAPCDTSICYKIDELRVLEFAGYGITYPGLFTVEFDVYCADELGCPVGPSLWNSGPWELAADWNYIPVAPALDISSCYIHGGEPGSWARFLVTATHTGTLCSHPEWGLDNISTLIEQSCDLYDVGGLPILYPRPTSSHYSDMRSGFYGIDFAYCPPQRFLDGEDTTLDGSQYGFIELAWRIHLQCITNATQPTTWGSVKSLYR